MRYVSSGKHLLFISVLTGLLGGVFFSTTANAVTTTGSYELKGKSQVIIRDTDIHNDNIYVALDNEPGASFSKDNKGTETCTLWLNSSDQTKLLKGEKPSTIRYEIKACSAKGNYQTKLLSGSGDAIDQQKKEDAKTDKAKVSAVAKYLIDKAPLLQMEYNGKLKNPDETGPAISACISQAVAQTAESEKLNAQAGLPAKNSDQIKDSHNNNFAICYAAKSGSDKDVILKYLKEQSGSEDLIGSAATVGSDAASEKQDELDEEPSCQTEISGIGWIVCPLINAMSTLNDGMWNIIEGLLESNPLEQNGPMYDLWIILRNIANALLVVGFIVIIYAQITGIGISNYGVKKMLPRLIIVAIAINLSYFIVTIMVDAFNILGSSLHSLLNDVYNGLGIGDDFTWESLMGVVLGVGGTAVVGASAIAISGGVTTLILLMLPSALAGLIGFLAALLTLMFRQAVIPLLAILAPIAFVAYLLPNTESLFTKWRKMFTSMLLLYPLAALLFGGMKVSGAVIASGGEGGGKAFTLLTGLIVMAAPLFMLPFLAKQSGSMLGTLGGKLQGLGGKLSKPVDGWSKGRAEQQRKKYETKPLRMGKNGKPIMRDRMRGWRQNSDMKRRTRDIQMGAYGAERDAKFNDYVMDNQESLAKGQGEVGQAYIAATAKRARAEAVKNAEMNVSSGDLDNVKSLWHKAVKSGDGVTAEAMQNKMLGAGGYGQNVYREALREAEAGGYMSSSIAREQKDNLLDNHGGVKNSSADLMKWASDKGNVANGNTPRSLSEVGKDSSTWTMSDADFASQHMLSQKEAISNGAIGSEQAYRIASDQRLSKDLAPDVRDKINELAKNYTPPANGTAPNSVKAPNGESFTQSDGGLYIPRDKS